MGTVCRPQIGKACWYAQKVAGAIRRWLQAYCTVWTGMRSSPCRCHPLSPHLLPQHRDFLAYELQTGVTLQCLLVGEQGWFDLPQRLVAGSEIGIGHGIVRSPVNGLLMCLDRLGVALLLLIHKAQIVVRLGILRGKRDGMAIGGLGFATGPQGGVCHTEEYGGGVMVRLQP